MSSDKINDLDWPARKLREVRSGNEVVISGVAGRFPDSDNVLHLQQNLMDKVDLISGDDRRWKLDHPEIPKRTGKLNNIEKFDARFFGIHQRQAHAMDPQIRMLLEHSYEAVVDAGINPRTIRGKKIGVFVGTSFSESEKNYDLHEIAKSGMTMTGCARAMFANRISYMLDLTGPSYALDTGCSSGLFAMENAYKALTDGLCEAAIVAGSNICLLPFSSLEFSRLGVLSKDGKCKPFDESADGYARSEAISAMFLQKAKDAKRVYATVCHAKTNCDGFKPEGITFPSTKLQSVLLEEFYQECGIPPTIVDFVEAHGTGTAVGDPEEANALDSVFTKGRKTPLKIGSSKSNYGHTEPVSGLLGVTKVLIAMETGIIPPNINFSQPKKNIKALVEGKITVVTEKTPWNGDYAAVNSFGFGGANAHVLLKSNPKKKINGGVPCDDLPRLVTVSGRTEEAVSVILKDLNSKPVDVEYVGLLHNIYSTCTNNHLHRGYTILPSRGVAETPLIDIKPYSGVKRPLWFVFSGMGSQWPGMGEALLSLPVFAAAIKKCDAVLKPLNVDIYNIITNKDKTIFNNILNSFVGIAAVQIGLVDVLRSVDIVPDNIIGHSVGELGCAYADGCFTAEQMILAAHSRGVASLEAKLIKGSMAAVGLGHNEVKKLCPPEIEVACHNSSDSATISGPAESMKCFVAKLDEMNIFAKEVPSSNIAYHSRYIAPAGAKLLSCLKKLIPDPKPRSSKWLSTSVPKDKWDSPAARFSSAEYHTNNLLSPVLFEETSDLIPKDAITIEIAPHGLLQAILRRSLGSGVSNIALTKRGHENNANLLLQSLGNMFQVGLHPQLANLYPRIEYPVSRGTQMISPLIKWEHTDDWFVVSHKFQNQHASSERIIKINVTEPEYEYITGHMIDGRNLFPATGYLFLIWQSFSQAKGEFYTGLPVVFEDVSFLRATHCPKDGPVEFTTMIHKGTGNFEIFESGAAVVTGRVRACTNASVEKSNPPVPIDGNEDYMTSRDVYKELRLRGYQYYGLFRSISRATFDGSKGYISWKKNWPAFMDNMLQMKILGMDSRALFVPTRIEKVIIDTKCHFSYLNEKGEDTDFPVYVDRDVDVIACGGIEVHGLRATVISRRKPAGDPVLEEYKFVPYQDKAEVKFSDIARLVTHIALENNQGIKVKTIELLEKTNTTPETLLTSSIFECLGDMPLIQAEPKIITSTSHLEPEDLPANVTTIEIDKIGADTEALLAIGYKLLSDHDPKNLNLLKLGLKKGGFIVSREYLGVIGDTKSLADDKGYDVILEKTIGSESYILLREKVKITGKTSVVYVNNNDFSWLEELKEVMSEELKDEDSTNNRILFVGQGQFENGLMGLVNCLRRETGGNIVRGLLIQDPDAPAFSLQNPFYLEQIEKDLVFNVLRKNGIWGSYRHLLLPPLKPRFVNHAKINQTTRGDLSSINWYEGHIDPKSNRDNLVNIFYSTINFKDVMLATGKLAIETVCKIRKFQESIIGFEYSGVSSSGKRICGILYSSGLSNLCECIPDLTWEVPNEWTLEDAATIPAVYATCYYALYALGQMQKGKSVLIHSGAGGIGQAAINLALHEGCEVYTTVGSPEKRHFIRKNFPSIPEDHIGNSRDTSFHLMVMKQTKGRGVDIVLNSLSEEKLRASVKCLAPRGHFLEIGKFDLAANNPLGMEAFLREISFQGVMLDTMITGPKDMQKYVHKLVDDGLKCGAVKPLTRISFPKDQVEAAFRFMASGKHIGKVLIKVRDEKEPLDSPTLALPRFNCIKDRSYIILGGLGGFGLELADWLVMRGAENLILTSRNGLKNSYQKMRIQLWQSYGVKVVIVTGKEASNFEDCQFIIETASRLAPVDGIFNLAVVLKDAEWENQTRETFEESFRTKAWATKQLDIVSRKYCPLLRYFVTFSSVSCGRGNIGQTNYGMSNSVMERICEKRVSEGLPGLAIQWGAIGDVGLVAEMQEDNKELVIGGTLQQSIISCLRELDGFMKQKCAIISSMVVAEKKFAVAGSVNIIETVLSIMGLKDFRGVSPNTSLSELGMDSMMGVEIKQTLEREFEVFLTAQDIRGLTFVKLEEINEKLSKPKVQSEMIATSNEKQMLEGMKMLIRLVNSRDIGPEMSIKLPSIEEKGTDEIFLIPGIEGLASAFSSVTGKIRSPITCLQLGTTISDSIPGYADVLLPHIMEKKKNHVNTRIIGYSFGALIAIELVRSLEAKGSKCELILIDGAPEPFHSFVSQMFPSADHSHLQNYLLLTAFDTVYPVNITEFMANIKKCSSWEEKIDLAATYLPKDKLYASIDDLKSLITAVYNRQLAILKYDIGQLPQIGAPITLLKPTVTSFYCGKDYGLSKVTKGEVKVYHLKGTHSTILDNEKIASLINGDSITDDEVSTELDP